MTQGPDVYVWRVRRGQKLLSLAGLGAALVETSVILRGPLGRGGSIFALIFVIAIILLVGVFVLAISFRPYLKLDDEVLVIRNIGSKTEIPLREISRIAPVFPGLMVYTLDGGRHKSLALSRSARNNCEDEIDLIMEKVAGVPRDHAG